MEKEKETQEGMFMMKWKNFIVMMISIIAGTNTANSLIFIQQQNTLEIAYNKIRADKIADRKKQEAIDYYDRKILEAKLEYCKNSK